jgi:ubiquinone/menaquinone biosynthesis C-methylase UbiE
MLRRARKLCHSRQWTNFVLIEADAANYASRELFDGVLFSFSYNVMPHHRSVLRQVWKQVRPGGRLVIMDARLPPGLFGKLIRPFATWLMKQTLLGNPLIRTSRLRNLDSTAKPRSQRSLYVSITLRFIPL